MNSKGPVTRESTCQSLQSRTLRLDVDSKQWLCLYSTPDFTCRAFCDATLVCFIVSKHTAKCSRYRNRALYLRNCSLSNSYKHTQMYTDLFIQTTCTFNVQLVWSRVALMGNIISSWCHKTLYTRLSMSIPTILGFIRLTWCSWWDQMSFAST